MIENNPSNVSSGFEMLQEEVEAEIDFFTRIGYRAFDSRDFLINVDHEPLASDPDMQRWGELRTTLDADLTLFTGFGEEEKYVDALLGRFSARTPEARSFALTRRVLLIRATNGKDVDIALGGFPFEKDMIRRATPFEFAPGVVLPTCSADDLFVMKVFAARGRDLHDAETIAIRQKLNRGHILRQLKPLCELKETPELVEQARRILEKHIWRA